MRWPKEFTHRSGNAYYLHRDGEKAKVAIYQWNSGKNKNFRVERFVKPFIDVVIPGKGDAAMKAAIEKAYELDVL